jgi:hypothetical protein
MDETRDQEHLGKAFQRSLCRKLQRDTALMEAMGHNLQICSEDDSKTKGEHDLCHLGHVVGHHAEGKFMLSLFEEHMGNHKRLSDFVCTDIPEMAHRISRSPALGLDAKHATKALETLLVELGRDML